MTYFLNSVKQGGVFHQCGKNRNNFFNSVKKEGGVFFNSAGRDGGVLFPGM